MAFSCVYNKIYGTMYLKIYKKEYCMKNKKLIITIVGVLAVTIATLIITVIINSSNNRPDIISINGHKISYYDDFTVGDNLYGAMRIINAKGLSEVDAENHMLITKSNIMSNSIHIYDSRIKTYKDITVGDNVSKINEKFKFAQNKTSLKCYDVKFKDGKEINNISDYGDSADSIFYICYYYNDNNIITNILIYEEPIKK